VRRPYQIAPAWLGLAVVALANATVVRAQLATPADSLAASPTHPIPRTLTPNEWDALNLGRAVDSWQRGDLHGAITLLETIDITTTSTFERADRAAFLLAAAYLRLEDADGFARVAERAGNATGSGYRKWIRYCQLAQHAQLGGTAGGTAGATEAAPAEFPGANEMRASLLLESGRANDALALLESSTPSEALASIHLYLQALARQATGGDPTRDWERLGGVTPHSRLEADLVGAALIQLATTRIEQKRDASDLLRRVPSESRHAPRAAHILASVAVSQGDSATARQVLSDVLKRYPNYDGLREVKLSLSDVALERGYWHAALRYAESAEDSWTDEFNALDKLENAPDLSTMWNVWGRAQNWRDEIRLASDALVAQIDAMATASVDLRTDPSTTPAKDLDARLWPHDDDAFATLAWDTTGILVRYAPTSEEWTRVHTAETERRRTENELAQQERVVAERKAEVDRRLAYLKDGRAEASSIIASLGRATTDLDSLLLRLDGALRQLEGARDGALRQIAERTHDMAVELQRERIFMQALRHFYMDGPQRERPEKFPPDVPTPSQVLADEQALTAEAESLVVFFATRSADVINRSYAEVWRPRFADDSRLLRGALGAQLARARRDGAALDSTLAAVANDPVLAGELAKRDILASNLASLTAQEKVVRRDVARAVARRGEVTLEAEREAIDYHVADASYELAVDAALDTEPNADSLAIAPLRARAIGNLGTFLSRYPESIARGETRFRLADLLLMQARDDFQAKMASFLGQSPSSDQMKNRAMAPFVDYAPAVDLYRAILNEDPNFPHQDAVLFNLGMILSDDGQAEASTYLTRLVQQYPNAPDAQEAWLRLGSDRFDHEDYAGCVPYFVEAAKGTDPSFTAIALYKLGWAQFEEDQFTQATDAFRRLIDHYAKNPEIAKKMDLRDEAEEYLVHSLARAGGASAFRDYFGSLGQRDYEARVLLSLGHLMRSLSLYEEAIDCDKLWLERYPQDPHAMDVVDRMAETYKNWNKPDAAREAKLAAAARLLPGSPWWKANDDEALHARAQSFSQSAYRENAAFYHKKARETNDPASWQTALTNYETYLTNWPKAPDADRIHFVAGEAAVRLKQYPNSLAHFAAAAQSDSAGLAVEASFQRVAVTDTWYQSVRPANAKAGGDSLGAQLLAACKEFTRLYPNDPRDADVVWRGGNVAYAHGWYPDAATAFMLFGDRFPADKRAPRAVRMAGDARYQRAEYDQAGAAYEKALALARAAKQDTLATALEKSIPVCYFKHAETVAKDKGDGDAAPLFARVATGWPTFPHADLALYRAGLGFAANQSYIDAAGAWEQLLTKYPKSEYARDATVQIAQAYEKSGNARSAADAYERFSRVYATDPDAPEALLKASELLAAAKDDAGAEKMRSLFIERFPGETETVMQIRAARAEKELAGVTSGTSKLSSLLSVAKPKKGAPAAPPTDLAAYLALAKQNPDLATPAILAKVDYLTAEEAHADYVAMKLTQPLPKSLEKKKAKLESTLELYNKCSKYDLAEYTRAAAYRVGQCLIEFGDALAASERPKDLTGDDLAAYDDVINQQSWEFYDRGEDVWSDLLTQTRTESEDPGQWIAKTRDSLWPRLAQEFLFEPAVEHPLVAAKPPAETGSK
jgi:TolA-binding protein